jgi:hypothetical protein
MRLIAGSGRSGTTWVLDALAAANRLRPVFEPLHPAVSDIGRRYAYRALSPDDDHAELERFLIEACAGKQHRMWIRYRGRPDLLLPPIRALAERGSARRLYRVWREFLSDMPELAAAPRGPVPIVKCIRANLMLGWLVRRFDCRTVLIVRHPGAVVESQLRLGRIWNPEPVLQRYRNDECLDQASGGRYRRLLKRPLSRIAALATNWVIENQLAIEQAGATGVTVIHYECLRAHPEREWQTVCGVLALPSVPDASLRATPSQQSSGGWSVKDEPSRSEPLWWRALTPAQRGEIQAILDQAQFDLYSMTNPEPRKLTSSSKSAPLELSV